MNTKLLSALLTIFISLTVILLVVANLYLQVSGNAVLYSDAAWMNTSTSRYTVTAPPLTNASSCNSQLKLSVSTDGRTPKDSIDLPLNTPTPYYLHVTTSTDIPCSVNLEVMISDNGKNTVVREWGPYKSDKFGVARIDLDAGWTKEQSLTFSVRAKGSEAAWSNQATLNFKSSIKPSYGSVNTKDYFKQIPGNVYIYNSANYWYNPVKFGLSYLQIESETNICGRQMIVWRFTKGNEYAYWGSKAPRTINSETNLFQKGDGDMRWFIADYNAPDTNYPNYSKYIWSYGFQEYTRNSALGAASPMVPGAARRAYVFLTTSATIPNYNLGREVYPHLPFIEYSGDLVSGYGKVIGKDCNLTVQNTNSTDFWKMRAEMDTVTISNPGVPNGYNYSGPALRIDYYEGAGKMTTGNFASPGFHRESFYFVKDVGLVQMLADNYNHYAGMDESTAPMCVNDSDCWANTIQNPTRTLVLKQYFNNPVFTVKVSKDDITYSDQITISSGAKYYLKITNVSYTGWLEAQLTGGRPTKWLWAENGKVLVSEAIMESVPAGKYSSRFRVWIPNENYPNESRVGVNNIPFSNQVTVNVL